MARYVAVLYWVPVYADVDLDEGTVTQVNIVGEGIVREDQLHPGSEAVHESFMAGNSLTGEPTEDDKQRAIDVAEGTAWPTWEYA